MTNSVEPRRQLPDAVAVTQTGRREFLKSTVLPAIVVGTAPAMLALGQRAVAGGPPRRLVVDAHMHVWANDQQRFPFAHPYVVNYEGMPHEGTVEMLIEDMDQHGCTHCVLVQTICHGWDNAYLADCLKRSPARFQGHGLIDPTDAKVADRLEYWTKEHGLVGMRFSPIFYQDGNHGGDHWLDADETHRLWRKAEQLGSVFNFFIAPRQLPRLATMAKAHPGVRVIVDHLSQMDLSVENPEPDLQLLLAVARHPNVWVKVSELSSVSKSHKYPFPDAYPYVKRVYDAFGPHRLLFGTGYPGTARAAYQRPTLAEEIELIDKHIPFFNSRDRARILGLNAAKLWALKT
ncbi:MAG: amidohydrolase [Pirellulales bacterium]|nr:amidohydrolase [Pirellulales bacterium]